jgi:hypothetical protein
MPAIPTTCSPPTQQTAEAQLAKSHTHGQEGPGGPASSGARRSRCVLGRAGNRRQPIYEAARRFPAQKHGALKINDCDIFASWRAESGVSQVVIEGDCRRVSALRPSGGTGEAAQRADYDGRLFAMRRPLRAHIGCGDAVNVGHRLDERLQPRRHRIPHWRASPPRKASNGVARLRIGGCEAARQSEIR